MSPWTVYWITRLDSINTIVCISLIVSLTVFVVSVVVYMICIAESIDESMGSNRQSRHERYAVLWKRLVAVSSVCLIIVTPICILTPSTKEAIAIYALPKIVNNEKVRQLPENAVDLINEQMKAWLGELSGKKEDK